METEERKQSVEKRKQSGEAEVVGGHVMTQSPTADAESILDIVLSGMDTTTAKLARGSTIVTYM